MRRANEHPKSMDHLGKVFLFYFKFDTVIKGYITQPVLIQSFNNNNVFSLSVIFFWLSIPQRT